ncbi:MAG TPA: amidohydrolase family protein [Gemmatimonadaceae bacterium]|nr:amidohydrolase family protein [Gemmatimonadaceae bacterium]
MAARSIAAMLNFLFVMALADSLGPEVRKFVRVDAPKIILEHVEVIDGTGTAPRLDQSITIEGGKITAIGTAPSGDGATVLDLTGYAVMPGIVGMHDHLWYQHLATPDRPAVAMTMTYSAPRLYLANGVTTLRTAASVDPYAELSLKHWIETGAAPGPHLDVTSPFLSHSQSQASRLLDLTGPDDARATVAFWADHGVTSFKAYQDITRDELRAAIQEAHKRGLKVTGHLCSVTYDEAIALGIDNLEHGFQVNTALDPDKKPDVCSASHGDSTLLRLIPGKPEADRLIASLIAHHVAVTSTLVGLSSSANPQRPLRPAVLNATSPLVRDDYLAWRDRARDLTYLKTLLGRETAMERAFVAAGGLLIAGPDPVGIGGNLPGFGDQREIELLVDAGWTPVEAIKIATLNGATFLGRQDHIGSIAPGKNADLVVIKGDPAARIADVENVEIVFKDGVGYDSAKLLDSVKGTYGEY